MKKKYKLLYWETQSKTMGVAPIIKRRRGDILKDPSFAGSRKEWHNPKQKTIEYVDKHDLMQKCVGLGRDIQMMVGDEEDGGDDE